MIAQSGLNEGRPTAVVLWGVEGMGRLHVLWSSARPLGRDGAGERERGIGCPKGMHGYSTLCGALLANQGGRETRGKGERGEGGRERGRGKREGW